MYLIFEVFQDISHSNKENPSVSCNAALSGPLMASNYANRHLRAHLSLDFWGTQEAQFQGNLREFDWEGKSAINLSNLGNFCQIWPQAIYLC